jgi:hypothetical protein
VTAGRGLLAEEAERALTEFDAEDDPDKAKETWQYGGDKLGEIRALVGKLRRLQVRVEEIAAVRADTLRRLRGMEGASFAAHVGAKAMQAMESRLLTSEDDLDELEATQGDALKLATAFRDALALIEAQEGRLRGQQAKTKLRDLREQLLLPATDFEAITEITDAVRQLPPEGADVAVQPAAAAGEPPARVDPGAPLRAMRTSLRRNEVITALFTGAVVLLAALSALYVGKPTWGSPADYLTAFLWGSVGGGAVKIAMRLIPAGSFLWR